MEASVEWELLALDEPVMSEDGTRCVVTVHTVATQPDGTMRLFSKLYGMSRDVYNEMRSKLTP